VGTCDSEGGAGPWGLISSPLRRRSPPWSDLGVLLLATAVAAASSCGPGPSEERRVEPVYSPTTGRLELLQYDASGDGQIDTWSYMDGTRIVRMELDVDQSGGVDRWEYYGPEQQVERIEVSGRRNGRADRFEYYEVGVLTRVEEDTSGNGKIDKWETYDGPRLTSVAFDTTERGTPDRRLVYAADGAARLETLP